MNEVTAPIADNRGLRLVVTRGIAAIGSTLTAFALDVWVFKQTGSYAIFAMIALFATLPSLLFAPFAGVITDRFNRRTILFVCDAISFLVVTVVLVAALLECLSVALVGLTVLGLAIASELRWSALGASISMLVPKERRGQINSVQLVFRGITAILGPILAAVGLDFLGLTILVAINAAAYLIAILGLMSIPFPTQAPRTTNPATSFWSELTYGFRWVLEHRGLKRLLIFFMLINIGLSVFTVSFAPYILLVASQSVLGVTLGLQGAGMFVMGLVLARFRFERFQLSNRILWGALCYGTCIFLWGLSRQSFLLFAIALALGALASVMMAASQTIWQNHVPSEIQGKVFSVRTVASFGLTPIAIFASIPIADRVFLPLTDNASGLRAIWGSGQVGAIGLMVSGFGAAIVLGTCFLIRIGGLAIEGDPDRHPTQRLAN